MYLKDLLEFFQKMVRLVGFRVTVCEISRVEIQKPLSQQNPVLSRVNILFTVTQNPTIHTIF